jgi:hypothetical protein
MNYLVYSFSHLEHIAFNASPMMISIYLALDHSTPSPRPSMPFVASSSAL